MVIGIYCRFSSQTDKEGGESSLNHQKQNGIKFCESNNFKYIIYSDLISGGELMEDRKEGRKLVDDLTANKIDGVWVDKEDRLYRNFNESVIFKKILIENNKKYFVGDSEVNFEDDSHQIVNTILSLMSEFEKRNINRRTKRGLQNSIDKGKILGVVNYGFRKDENLKWVVEESEANKIREVVDIFLKKDFESQIDWVLYCNKLILKEDRKSKIFYTNLYKKKTYNGLKTVKFNDKVYEFEIPKIIDDFTFNKFLDKVNRLIDLSKTNTKKKRSNKVTSILNGILYCGGCGKRLNKHTLTKKSNKDGRKRLRKEYYRCRYGMDNSHRELSIREENRNIKNHKTNFNIDFLDNFIFRVLVELLFNSKIVRNEYRKKYLTEFDVNKGLDKVNQLRKELSKLESEEIRLEEGFLSGIITNTNLTKHKERLSLSRLKIEGLIESEKSEIDKHNNLNEVVSWIDKFKSEYSVEAMMNKSAIEKKEIVRKYIQKIVVVGRQHYNDFDFDLKIKLNIPLIEDTIRIDKEDYRQFIKDGGESKNWKKKYIVEQGKSEIELDEIMRKRNKEKFSLLTENKDFSLYLPLTNISKFNKMLVDVSLTNIRSKVVNLNDVVIDKITIQ